MNSQNKIDLSILLHSGIKRAIHNNRPSPLSYKEKNWLWPSKRQSEKFLVSAIKTINIRIFRLSEPEFYGDLDYKFKKLIGRIVFSFQFRKKHYTLQTYRL